MVYYYETTVAAGEPVVLYMGKDKFENEDLIRYGLECDVWFHVDNLSSAHVYARLPKGMSWDAMPTELLQDCAQLTKANSIAGNKKDNVTVIYTPWSNLHKNGSMATGQVAMAKQQLVKKVFVKTRDNSIVNRLNKTQVERSPNFEQEKADYEKAMRREFAEEHRLRQKSDLETAREYKRLADLKNKGYSELFADNQAEHNLNQFRADDWEEDFM